jgi:hypothetical protein
MTLDLIFQRLYNRVSYILGVRLTAGQQALDLLMEVRILHPQPGRKIHFFIFKKP